MTFYNKTKKGKDKADKVNTLMETEDVFMTLPYDDNLYLKFYTENGIRKMSVCAKESNINVTYAITGQRALCFYPSIENILLVKQLLDARKRLF